MLSALKSCLSRVSLYRHPLIRCILVKNVPLKYSTQLQAFQQSRLSHKRRCICYAGILSMFGLVGEHKEDAEKQITDVIKMAIFEQRAEHYKKAEQLLHLALKMAQEVQNADAVVYIYDTLANCALERGDLNKAEILFKSTMQLLLQKGMPADDNAILEISLKLAGMYGQLGKKEEAHTGFLYVLNHLNQKINLTQFSGDEDTVLLWAMCADSYGRFLMGLAKYDEAGELFLTAYKLCKATLGSAHPQTLVLVNNLGSAMGMAGNHSEGINYLKQAINTARDNDIEDLPAYYHNLGMLYLHMGKFMEAEDYCKKASTASKKESSYHLEAINCLEKVHNLKNC